MKLQKDNLIVISDDEKKIAKYQSLGYTEVKEKKAKVTAKEADEKSSESAKNLIAEQNNSLTALSQELKKERSKTKLTSIQRRCWGLAIGYGVTKIVDR